MFDIVQNEDVILYGVILITITTSIFLYYYIWHILYAIICVIDYILFEQTHKYGSLIIVCCLLLVVLAYLLVRNYKKIKHVNLAPQISEEDYNIMKKVVTKKCLSDLKKHPRYNEVKRIAEQNAKERQRISQSTLRLSKEQNFFDEFSDQ